MSAEESVEQFASGAVGGMTPVQVWRTRSIGTEDVQLLKTSRVDYLKQRRPTGPGSLQMAAVEICGSTSLCQVMGTLPVLNLAWKSLSVWSRVTPLNVENSSMSSTSLQYTCLGFTGKKKISVKHGAKRHLIWFFCPFRVLKADHAAREAGTHIRFKWRFHKSCLQHPEIDFLEKMMRLYVSPRCTLAAQPVLWVFSQQLWLKRKKKPVFLAAFFFIHLWLARLVGSPEYRFVSPRRWTFLHIPPGPSGFFSPCPTCWGALHGLGTEALRPSFHKWGSRGPTSQRSCRSAYGRSPQELESQTRVITHLWNQLIPTEMASNLNPVCIYPCTPGCPPCHEPASHPSAWQPGPGHRCGCDLSGKKKKSKYTLKQPDSLISYTADSLFLSAWLQQKFGFSPTTTFK